MTLGGTRNIRSQFIICNSYQRDNVHKKHLTVIKILLCSTLAVNKHSHQWSKAMVSHYPISVNASKPSLFLRLLLACDYSSFK